MIYLFVGFLAPAILFLILGLFACLKKTTSRYEDKDYQSIYSNEENHVQIRMPPYDQNGTNSYQMIYENPHFIEYKYPPTYREAIKHQAQTVQPSRHLPPNQPKILDHPTTQHTHYAMY